MKRLSLLIIGAILSINSWAVAGALYDEVTPDGFRKYKGINAVPLTGDELKKLDSCLRPTDAAGNPKYYPGYEPYITDQGDCSRLLDQHVEAILQAQGLPMDCYFTKETVSIFAVAQNLCQYTFPSGKKGCFQTDLIIRSPASMGVLKNEISQGMSGECY